MFSQIKERLLSITNILFVNNLDFLTSGHFFSIIDKLLEKVNKIAFK